MVKRTDNRRGSTVEYKCSKGYILDSGHLKRTCGNDGQWSGQEPHCSKGIDYNQINTSYETINKKTYIRAFSKISLRVCMFPSINCAVECIYVEHL